MPHCVVNVPGDYFPLAGFEVTTYGRFWVTPEAIYQREDGGNVMYYMIHATDHPAAPGLMYRAYHKAVSPREPEEQLALEFGLENLDSKVEV